ARLAPTPEAGRRWAGLAQEVSDRLAHGLAVNLDPAALILDTVLKIKDRAAA
ncbi:MAG: DNA polymerase III subunit delta', partial [Paracoccaceae bacterium]